MSSSGASGGGLTRDTLAGLYRKMVTIRAFENKGYELYGKGLLPGAIHSSEGEEASCVGVLSNLTANDFIFTTHRGHGHCICQGAELRSMACELLGKVEGLCRGKGGSMHFFDVKHGIMGSNGIVGDSIPLAVGGGLSAKMRHTDQVSVAIFGDGASNMGAFHESMNMASIWKLPVIFLCENNGYAMSTPAFYSVSVPDIATRAQGYSMPGITVDGQDLFAVYEVAAEAVARARRGEGPVLIESKTYRYRGHARSDPAFGRYREREEVEEWQKRDPIKLFEAKGVLTESEMKSIKDEMAAQVESAFEYALQCPYPAPEVAAEYVFAN